MFSRLTCSHGKLLALVVAIVLAAAAPYPAAGQQARSAAERKAPAGSIQSAAEHPIAPAPYPANIEYNNGGYGVYSQAALANPNIGAVDVTLDWKSVEPQQGGFDWAPLDNELQAWATAGKKLTLIIRYAPESRLDTGTACHGTGLLPAWEVARIPTFCDTDKETLIPDYFDATFQSDLKAYIEAIAQHVAAGGYQHSIVFVRVGLGLGGEGYPLSNCYGGCDQSDYQADIQQLENWGFTPERWLNWQESMLSYAKSVFSYTTVVYGINQMFSPASNPLNFNPATGNPIQMDVAYFAAANGMGVGQQGLAGSYVSDYAKINEIIAYINQHYPDTFIQFAAVGPLSQTPPCNTNPTTSCEVGIVQQDIQTLEQFRARTMDWWSQDDSNPAFQPYFAQWQQWVTRTFGGSGRGPAGTPGSTPDASLPMSVAASLEANAKPPYQASLA